MAETSEVQLHFLDYWRVVKNRWGIITLTFLLVVVTAYITTYFLERYYRAQVSIEVKSDHGFEILGQGEGNSDYVDPHFVANQLKRLQSKGILYPVIEQLDLVKKWSGSAGGMSEEQAFFKLQGMMNGLTEVRNTDFLLIPVTSTDPKEAAAIANMIAIVYQKKRVDDQKETIDRALAELGDEVTKQREIVDKAAQASQEVRTRLGIIDNNPDEFSTGSPDSTITRDDLTEQAKLNDAKQKVEDWKNRQAQIEKMPNDELMNALTSLGIPDPTISDILPKYQAALTEEAELKSDLGPEHPRLKSLRAKMVIWKKQLDDELDAVKKNVQTQLTIAQGYLDSQQQIYDKTHANALNSSNTSAEYLAVKQNYISAKRLLDSAQQRYSTEAMQISISHTPAEIWDKAEPPQAPSSPNVFFDMLIAVGVAMFMGVGLAFFLEYLDTSVKTLADVEKFIGVSVLAVVPKIGGLLHKSEEGHSPDAETYRTLRTNIDFHKPSPDANTLTVISGGPGEGKSTTLCNLAVICANAGSNVLIVDADLRRPSQHKFFDLDGTIGLVNYVNGDKEFEDIIQQTPVDNLWLIPSGSTTKDPVAILSSHRLVEFIARAKTQFDLVLFDSPPILGLSDGSVLSSIVEMTVMVVQHRRFPRASLLRVKQAVLNVGGNLTGVVLNRVDTRDDQNYYYYTSYYDYYSPIPPEVKAKAKADI